MSTNCIRCVTEERTGSDLFCDTCRLETKVKELEAELHQTTNMLIACQTSILHNESCNKPTLNDAKGDV